MQETAPFSIHRNKLINRLSQLDWNFETSKGTQSLHSIHPYPAKFIPEIPLQLIHELGLPAGTSVLDPFCGSGTTLTVSQKLGFSAVGIDLNPIACLISNVKTSALENDILTTAEDIVESARSKNHNLNSVQHIPNLDHWFNVDIQKSVLALKEEIKTVEEEPLLNALNLCLSSILVRVSNQDSDTRYAAVNKKTIGADVYNLFLAAVKNLQLQLSNRNYDLSPVTVLNKDVLSTTRNDINSEIGLVVTSPPYPNAYEYWLYHKYRMFWLDFDPIAVKQKEIGARAHFFKKNHHTADDFYHQMLNTLVMINSVLIPGGYCAFVVGRSKIHGKIVENAALIKQASEKIGFEYIGEIERNIKASRKSFNLAHANIKSEKIVILKK